MCEESGCDILCTHLVSARKLPSLRFELLFKGYVGVTRKLQVSFCMVYYDSFICTCMRGDVSKSVTRVEHLQSVGRVESKGNSSVQECLYLL